MGHTSFEYDSEDFQACILASSGINIFSSVLYKKAECTLCVTSTHSPFIFDIKFAVNCCFVITGIIHNIQGIELRNN